MNGQDELITWIRKEMQKRGINQKGLAGRTDMTEAMISKILTGVHAPRMGTLNRILKALDARLVIVRNGEQRNTEREEAARKLRILLSKEVLSENWTMAVEDAVDLLEEERAEEEYENEEIIR